MWSHRQAWPSTSNISGNPSTSLQNVILSMSALFVITILFFNIWASYQARLVRAHQPYAVAMIKLYSPALALVFSFLSLSLVAVLYWGTLTVEPPDGVPFTVGGSTNRKLIYWGFLVGCASFLASLPFGASGPSLTGVIGEVYFCKSCILLYLSCAILVLGLPIVTEAVFRGIVFRVFRHYTTLWGAIAVSCGVSALLWQVFTWPISLIFGIGSCLLYERTRRVAPSIVANMTMSVLALGLRLYLMRRMF
jgi:membrane protease YdiL (CAAX protease family)